jgi:phosphohistidine swiveling domain-containing protein
LAVLTAARVRVVETAVLTPETFSSWLQVGEVSAGCIEAMQAWCERLGRAGEKLMIRASLPCYHHGLEEKQACPRSFTAMRFAVEKVFRSWGSEMARASRLRHHIRDDESFPSIVIQPFVEDLLCVITRHAVRGTLTDESDCARNVQNTLPRFSRSIGTLIEEVDRSLLRPVKICLRADTRLTLLEVVSVSDEIMTSDGRWRAYAKLLEGGLITDLQFLCAIKPDMLGLATGWEFDESSTTSFVAGVAASAGMSSGDLVFRQADFHRIKNLRKRHRLIFLTTEASPEDLLMLECCAGAIGLSGGMTSHLAVICRGMQKPAVTGCGGRLDLLGRTYRLPNGESAAEFSKVLLDGTTGHAAFSDKAGIRPKWTRTEGSEELAARVLQLADRIVADRFDRLPMRKQLHVARLKSRLREMGRIE